MEMVLFNLDWKAYIESNYIFPLAKEDVRKKLGYMMTGQEAMAQAVEGKFCVDIRKKFFTTITTKHWNR